MEYFFIWTQLIQRFKGQMLPTYFLHNTIWVQYKYILGKAEGTLDFQQFHAYDFRWQKHSRWMEMPNKQFKAA